MTIQEVLDTYVPLNDQAKVVFLTRVSHALTISMRGVYDSTEDPHQLIERFKGSNELQHQLSSQLRHLHQEDPRRYPDDVFINILVEKSTYYHIGGELAWALKFAMNRT
jgi:FPC/CPF motif-containing protein YcgG